MSLAGFLPVEARQAARARSPVHALHLIRLRRRYETVQLRDAIPEILFLNSHDGTSAYQLRVGLFRVICTNGLVVSAGVFPVWRVMHRGDVAADVVAAALQISERFEVLAAAVERMERTPLDRLEQLDFAAEALALRFPKDPREALEPSRFLVPGARKTSVTTSGTRSTYFRRTSCGAGSCDARLPIACVGPDVSPASRKTSG